MSFLVATGLTPWALAAYGLLVYAAARAVPRIRCGRWTRRAVSAGLLAVAMPAFMWSWTTGGKAVVVILAIGLDEYQNGLRVVSKHGDLSDGRQIGPVWHGAWGVISMFLAALALVPNLVFAIRSDPTPPAAESAES